VQFYWREANAGESDHPVPAHLFEELTPQYRCMKGTNDKHHPKCGGLKGRIGVDASCSIYPLRPSPCRDFKASFEDGVRQPRCDEARERHGLKPLTAADW
jgi:Fe-S-cluster containining protein